MEPALIFLLFFGVVAAVFWFGLQAHKRLVAEFAVWASSQGLAVREGPWWSTPLEATGMRSGRRVEVSTFTTGSGKSRKTWLAVVVKGVPGRLELSLVRQGFGTKISEWFGTKEIQVGDAAFDARWFVRSNRSEFVAAALLPEIRTRIDEVAGLGGRSLKIELKDGRANYVEQGGISSKSMQRVERVFPLLEELVALAEVEAEG
jgi:hypothetical protein